MRMKSLIYFTLILFIAYVPDLKGAERDGNGWRTLSNTEKTFFAAGLIDGIDFGAQLPIQAISDENCGIKAAESFFRQHDKYVVGVATSQVVDGMDAFYSDFKNRKIPVRHAFAVILKQIAGDSNESISKLTENLRKGRY
jgi:hypothetical protein